MIANRDRKHPDDRIAQMQAAVDRIDHYEGWRPRTVVERGGKLRIVDAETGEYDELLPRAERERRRMQAVHMCQSQGSERC